MLKASIGAGVEFGLANMKMGAICTGTIGDVLGPSMIRHRGPTWRLMALHSVSCERTRDCGGWCAREVIRGSLPNKPWTAFLSTTWAWPRAITCPRPFWDRRRRPKPLSLASDKGGLELL